MFHRERWDELVTARGRHRRACDVWAGRVIERLEADEIARGFAVTALGVLERTYPGVPLYSVGAYVAAAVRDDYALLGAVRALDPDTGTADRREADLVAHLFTRDPKCTRAALERVGRAALSCKVEATRTETER